MASGVLGTFFGLFNNYEINQMIDDLDEVKNKQSLLLQISKTHEHQIQTIK